MEPPYDDEYDDEEYDDRRDDGEASGPRKGLIIGILVVLVLIAGAVVALVAVGSDDDGDSTVAEPASTTTTVRRTTSTTSASTTTTAVDITTTTAAGGSTTTTAPGGSTTSTSLKPSSGNTTAPGTNVRLDQLWNSCRDGNLQDCDRLYSQAPSGSTYSAFGDTCGNRRAAGGGYCVKKQDRPVKYGDDDHLDALHDGCRGGNFTSCDQLYLDSYSGSEYETFGSTCGGRDPASETTCVDRHRTTTTLVVD